MVELLSDLGQHWEDKNVKQLYEITANIPFHEAGLLKLNCDKALFHLKWEPTLDYYETISLVGDWYQSYYKLKREMYGMTINQIEEYERFGSERERVWSKV